MIQKTFFLNRSVIPNFYIKYKIQAFLRGHVQIQHMHNKKSIK